MSEPKILKIRLTNINPCNVTLQMSLFESTEQIGEDQKASEMKLVYYNLMIVAIFIFCHTIKWIPNVFEWTLTHTDEVRNGNMYLYNVLIVCFFL